MSFITIVLLWIIVGHVFTRFHEIDRGIPPGYKD